jgi:N-acetylneuraminic acid mutarotase
MAPHSSKSSVRDTRTLTIVLVACATALASMISPCPASAASWSSRADVPTCRYYLPAAAVGTNSSNVKLIYVIGDESTNAVEAYNPATDSWSTKTSMPGTPMRYGFAAVTGGNGKIYAMGGIQAISGGSVLDKVQAYDPVTDQWTTVASMQVARYRPAASVGPDGRIYVFGGQGTSGALNGAEVYDPQTNSWTFISPLPGFGWLGACAALVKCSNTIYVVGGGGDSRVQAYNTASGAWSARADYAGLPTDFAMVTGRDDRLYVVGGNRDPHGPTNELFIYEPLTDTWTQGPSMSAARSLLAAASLGSNIYAIAGNGDDCQAMESYGPLPVVSCPCLAPPSGMVAWWPLDEVWGTKASDVVGGTTGPLVGGATHAPGMVDGGLKLSSAAQYVSVGNVPAYNFGTSSFSIDAWIRTLDAATPVRTIVDKRSGSGTPTGYSLGISFGRLVLQLADGTGFTNFSQGAAGNLTDGSWHHVAVTVDRIGNVGKLYDNGAVVHSFTPSVQPGSVTNSGSLRIGQAYDNSSIDFNGDIDEVEMFGRALSQAEVVDLWQAGALGKCKPLTVPVQGPWSAMALSALLAAGGLVAILKGRRPGPVA